MASQFDNRNDILTRYNYERERRRRATAQAQPIPQMMSAHEPVVNPNANVNPFQDNFTPNTNTVSMQDIARQVAPRIEQPLLERIGRGAANIPIGMAAMAEQVTSDPVGFAKGTGEYLNTWAQRLNPNPIAPSTIQARAEWGQQFATDPVGSTLDAAGVAGTALGLPALGGKINAFRNRAASRVPEIIRKAVEPEVVPEVAQKPVIPEPPQVPEIIRQAVEPQDIGLAGRIKQAGAAQDYEINALAGNIHDHGIDGGTGLKKKAFRAKIESVYNSLPDEKKPEFAVRLATIRDEFTSQPQAMDVALRDLLDNATPAQSIELGALGTPSALSGAMKSVGKVAEKTVIPIQYIAKKIDGFMEKRGLANPLGTPEIVLKDTGIVEAFRDATAKEHAFVAEQSAKLREILGGRIKNERYLAEMFRHLDNPEAILNPTEKAMRGWFDEMLNTVNEFRIRRGEEPINYTEGYIPHIFKKSKELLDADHSIALPRKAQNRFANVRTGAEGYEKDLIQALELYTKATARDMYVNDALHASIPAIEAMSKNGSKILRREVITTPDGASKTINFYNLNNADMWSKRGYAEAFVRAQLGLPTQGQRFFKQLGINPRTSQRVSNMATGLVYRNLLGMAIDTGIKNLSQVTHTIAENGMAPTLRGIGKFLTPEGIKTARAEHLLKEFDAFLLSEDMPAATRAKIFKQFDENVINGAMRFSEFVNRGIAYHTALDDAIKAGKSIADAHEIALKAVRGTQFEYNKLGTSPFMRGPLTRPAAQFMTFPVKTSEMLYRWANEGNTGRGKLLRYFATVGGLVYAGKEAGVELGNIFFDPTKTVDKDSKDGIELPLSGNKVKLDPLRLGTTGFAPQGAVPAVTKPYKYINDLITKDRTAGQRVGQAAREFLPGGRFIGKAVDVATGSEYRDERGRLIRKDSKADAFLKLFGGRSSNQESMNNKKSEVRDIEQEYYETRRKIIDTQLNGDVEGAKRMIADFSEKYPYLGSRLRKSLRQGRKDELRKRQMTSDERFYDNKIRQRIEQNL